MSQSKSKRAFKITNRRNINGETNSAEPAANKRAARPHHGETASAPGLLSA